MNKNVLSYLLLFSLIQPICAQDNAVSNTREQAIVLGKGLGWSALALLSCIIAVSRIDNGQTKFYKHKESLRKASKNSDRITITKYSYYPSREKIGYFMDRLEVAGRVALYNNADVFRSMIITVCAGLVGYYAAHKAVESFYQLHAMRVTANQKKSISLKGRYDLHF